MTDSCVANLDGTVNDKVDHRAVEKAGISPVYPRCKMNTSFANSPDGTRVAYDRSGAGPAMCCCMVEAARAKSGTRRAMCDISETTTR